MLLLQFLLPAIVAILAILLIPYAIGYWAILNQISQCPRCEGADPDQMPDHLNTTFQSVIVELEPYGFEIAGYYLFEGVVPNEKVWGVVLQHQSQQTYATLTVRYPLEASHPTILALFTFFADDCLLVTQDLKDYKIFSPNPKQISQWLDTVPVEVQWQAHQQKLAELSETKPVCCFSLEEWIARVEKHAQSRAERLVQTGEFCWVQQGKSYRFSWWVAFKIIAKIPWWGMTQDRQERKAQSPLTTTTDLRNDAASITSAVDLEVGEFYRQRERKTEMLSRSTKSWLLLGTLALFVAVYAATFEPYSLVIFVAVLLLHEGGHVLAMKWFGYQDTTMLFIPFLGALATARKDHATLTEKVWISLAGPLPGLVLGIGLAIVLGHLTFNSSDLSAGFDNPAWVEEASSTMTRLSWLREASLTLIGLNLFNLLPVYPLDGGQVADLLLFSSNPYLGVMFKGIGVLLLALIGLTNPLFMAFAALIALSIPNSFRVAKLSAQLRQDLRQVPSDSEEQLVRVIFEKLQAPAYRSLPIAQKSNLASGLLASHRDNAAPWTTRVGLSGVYLVSLLIGLGGGLYAIMPSWSVFSDTIGTYIEGRETNQRRRATQQIERANRALQANPKDINAYLERGRVRSLLKDDAGAIADANQILKLDPNSSEGYQLRSSARRRMGDSEGAKADRLKARNLALTKTIQQQTKALQTNPNNAEAHMRRAEARSSLGDHKGAIADYNQVIKLRPQYDWAFTSRGSVYLQMKDYNRAIADATQALQINPQMAEAYELRSEAYKQLGDQPRAIADRLKAEALYAAQGEGDE